MRRSLPRFPLWIAAACLAACAPEGPTGFVTFNLPPDGNCRVSPETNQFIAIGRYDISPGGNGNGNNCERPYVLALLVNSYLRPNRDTTLGRAEPNILQIHSAEVHLMDINQRTIAFDRFADALPNPFRVTTNNSLFPTDGDQPSTAIAAVESIPTAYAEQLDGFVGEQILAEIQIFGTTTGDVDVDLKPFVYPIEICDGCLTMCLSDLERMNLSLEQAYGMGICRDNAGADGRLCLDREC